MILTDQSVTQPGRQETNILHKNNNYNRKLKSAEEDMVNI